MEKPQIEFSEFIEISEKLDIKIGMVVGAKRIPKKDKLLELLISFGEERKICVTNLGEIHEPEDFLGNILPFITNLEPAKMGGVVSEVMLMVSELEGGIRINMSEFQVGAFDVKKIL